MKYYAGLDVSMKETFICIMGETGNTVYESKCYSDPDCIFKCLSNSKLTLTKVGLESGSLSSYLTKGLSRLGVPAICIDARKMAAILAVTINKTDKNDARGIADALRCNHYREVHVKTEEDEATGILLKSRSSLIQNRLSITNRIRGFLKTYGVRLKSVSPSLLPSQVRDCLDRLSPYAITGVEGLLKTLETIYKQIKVIEKDIKKLASKNKQVKQLMTVPGVGVIVATNFLSDVGNPERFKKSISVGAYYGMTPRQYSSGETVRQGGVSKCGSRDIRGLLHEAGVVLLTRTKFWFPLKAWGVKLAKKYGLQKASMAVGRKLAVIMHRMLITGENFRYTNS
jgi:transposase